MSDSTKIKPLLQMPMDKTDLSYVIELLEDGIKAQDWDSIHEANEFLKEYIEDDESPTDLEE